MAPRTYLESIRLEFLIPEESDREALAHQVSDSDPSVSKVNSLEIADWILEHWGIHGFGPCLAREKSSGDLIGIAGLKIVSQDEENVVDFGMSFLPAKQRQGFGFEAGVAWFRFGFSTLNLKRIVSATSHDNVGVLKLFSRWGFEFVEDISYVDALGTKIPSEMWELTPLRFDSLLGMS